MYTVYLSKEKSENHMELLLIENEHKFHYLFIKEINEFMYNKTKHNDKKHCLEISGKQVVNMLKKVAIYNLITIVNSCKHLLWFMQSLNLIWKKFKKSNGDNADTPYTDTYQKHIACSYGLCIDYRFSKPVQTYQDEKIVHKFIEKILEEVGFCKEIEKKHSNKELVINKKDKINLEKLINVIHVINYTLRKS